MARVVKNPVVNAGDIRDAGLILGLGRSPGGRVQQPTPVFLPKESHGQRILEGYSPWGHKRLDKIAVTLHAHVMCHKCLQIHYLSPLQQQLSNDD